MMLSALVPIDAAHAASAAVPGARKHARHTAYAARPYYPAYYGRPAVYAPAPFVPIPPLFGYGWEWW
jgi:hypothetical protein